MPDTLAQIPKTQCLFKATLAAGTTTTISTTGTVHFAINGLAYLKTAITNGATPTTDANGGNFKAIVKDQGTVVVVGFDKADAVVAAQGGIETLDSAGKFIYAPQFPPIPDTMCPIGYIIVQGGSTLVGTWTFGTDNLSGVTGMTYTFVDVSTLPDRPQVP